MATKIEALAKHDSRTVKGFLQEDAGSAAENDSKMSEMYREHFVSDSCLRKW